MISKNDIKFIRSLSQKKFRDENGLFIAEGEKIVNEAISSRFEIAGIYKTSEIGEDNMSRISQLNTPSPILAVIRKPDSITKDEINSLISRKPLSLALDGLRDPGNVGTIIRLADWFGIDAIFASKDTVEIFNPKVVQATMGAIFRIKFIYCDLNDIISSFTLAKIPIYGTFLDGDSIYSTDLSSSGLIVMGSESNGISNEVASMITQRLFISPCPADAHTSESLNVAIATSIVCSEFRRRNY